MSFEGISVNRGLSKEEEAQFDKEYVKVGRSMGKTKLNASKTKEEIPFLQSKMEFFAYEKGRASAIKEFKEILYEVKAPYFKRGWITQQYVIEEVLEALAEKFEKELGGTK